jgi:hypothetical protein
MVAKRISSHPAYERSMREHFYPGLRKAGVRE